MFIIFLLVVGVVALYWYIDDIKDMLEASDVGEYTAANISDVTEIVIENVLEPESAGDAVTYVFPDMLEEGDVVSPQAGDEVEDHVIEKSTWFVFIDDEPQEMFPHTVRYVFIDAATGDHSVIDEQWWPTVNGVSIWDSQDSGEKGLVIYSI